MCRGLVVLGVGQDYRAGEDQGATYVVVPGHVFVEEDGGEDDGDDHAELVDRRDLGSFAELQRAEIAKPGKSGGKAGEDQEDPCAAADGGERLRLGEEHDGPGKDQDDDGADGGGEIGVHVFDADFGEDGGESGEEGGE